MPSVLFVCTANICRSPMAEALFRRIVNEAFPKEKWRIESAGTWAINSQPASENARLVMHQKGLEIGHHRSRRITKDILSDFDLILTMAKGHKEALILEFPLFARRVFMLSEMVGQDYDIEDPIGRSEAEYAITSDKMEALLTQGLNRICQLVELNSPQ